MLLRPASRGIALVFFLGLLDPTSGFPEDAERLRVARLEVPSLSALLERLEEVTSRSGVIVKKDFVLEMLAEATRTRGLKGLDLDRPFVLEGWAPESELAGALRESRPIELRAIAAMPIASAEDFRQLLEHAGASPELEKTSGRLRWTMGRYIFETVVSGDIAYSASDPALLDGIDPRTLAERLTPRSHPAHRAFTIVFDWRSFYRGVSAEQVRRAARAGLAKKAPPDEVALAAPLFDWISGLAAEAWEGAGSMVSTLDLADDGLIVEFAWEAKPGSALSKRAASLAPEPPSLFVQRQATEILEARVQLPNRPEWRSDLDPALSVFLNRLEEHCRKLSARGEPERTKETSPAEYFVCEFWKTIGKLVREVHRFEVHLRLHSEGNAAWLTGSAMLVGSERGAEELVASLQRAYANVPEPERLHMTLSEDAPYASFEVTLLAESPTSEAAQGEPRAVALGAKGALLAFALVRDPKAPSARKALEREIDALRRGQPESSGGESTQGATNRPIENVTFRSDMANYFKWLKETGKADPVLLFFAPAFEGPNQELWVGLRIDGDGLRFRLQAPPGAYAVLAHWINYNLGQVRARSR